MNEDFVLNRENGASCWSMEQLEPMFQGPGDINRGKEELQRSCVYVGLLTTHLQDFVGITAKVSSTSCYNKDP